MYVSPKAQQHRDGNAEQRRIVADILADIRRAEGSRPRSTMPRTRTVWNACLQTYVEVR